MGVDESAAGDVGAKFRGRRFFVVGPAKHAVAKDITRHLKALVDDEDSPFKGSEVIGWWEARGDEQIAMVQVAEQLAAADVVIADISGNNPNVTFEVGIAKALGTPVVLLYEENADAVAFNLVPFRRVEYVAEGEIVPEVEVPRLRDSLTKELMAVLEAGSRSVLGGRSGLDRVGAVPDLAEPASLAVDDRVLVASAAQGDVLASVVGIDIRPDGSSRVTLLCDDRRTLTVDSELSTRQRPRLYLPPRQQW